MLASAIERIIAAGTSYCKGAVERLFRTWKTLPGEKGYAALEAVIRGLGLLVEASGLSDGFFSSSPFDSPMPSRMLEQLAQILGFRADAFPPIDIG
jgi:hypothetical protein